MLNDKNKKSVVQRQCTQLLSYCLQYFGSVRCFVEEYPPFTSVAFFLKRMINEH